MKVWMWLLPFAVGACDITVTTTPCEDGILNGSESDTDCGGSCTACGDGRTCNRNSDCQSGVCGVGSRCITPSDPCANGVLDGNETDVDCGGSCSTCADGFLCAVAADCQSGVCASDSRCGIPPVSGLPDSTGAQVYNLDPGASLVVTPGSQAGFGITGNNGGTYRIVWTGEGATTGSFNRFSGTIWTTGTFDSFSTGCGGQCPLESNDVVDSPQSVNGGSVITFDAVASTGLDGFDFSSTVEPVYFDLLIDGTRQPTLVFFSSGGATANAGTDPFGLSTQ